VNSSNCVREIVGSEPKNPFLEFWPIFSTFFCLKHLSPGANSTITGYNAIAVNASVDYKTKPVKNLPPFTNTTTLALQ
jgi:hypothetical protein